MRSRLLSYVIKRILTSRWLIPGLMVGVMFLWELTEHAFLDPDEMKSPTVFLDLFLVTALSIIVGVFASRMQEEIAVRETTQKALQQRGERLTALYTLVTQINQTRDLDKVLTIALDQVMQLVGVEGGGVWLFEEPEGPLVLKARRGLDDSFFQTTQRLELEEPLREHLVQMGSPIVVDDTSSMPAIAELAMKKSELQSCVCMPLYSHNEVAGILSIYSRQRRRFTSQDLSLLAAIASQVSVAIESAQLYEAVRQQLAEITILQGIAWLTSSSLDLEQMLHTVIRALSEVFEYPSFGIFLLEDGEMVLRAHITHNADYLPPPDTKLCWQAISTGAPAFRPADGGKAREMSVPLKIEDTALGALYFCAAPHQTLSQTDARLFSALANQISVGIRNAQLYAEVKSLNEQLQEMIAERTQELEASRLEVAQKARQLQQLLAEVAHLQDEERNRIAFDMHDGLTQLVIGALYESQAAEEALAIKPEMTLEKLQNIQNLLQQTKEEIHRIVHNLHTPGLETMGLVPALKRYLVSYRQLVGIPCQLHISGEPFRLGPEVETAIYRIVQEALHNVGKHAQANSSQVFLDFGLRNVRVVIQDDGRGFDVEASMLTEDHLGLRGMKRRAQSIGGRLEIDSAPDQGTRVILEIPRPDVAPTG